MPPESPHRACSVALHDNLYADYDFCFRTGTCLILWPYNIGLDYLTDAAIICLVTTGTVSILPLLECASIWMRRATP